MAEDEAVPDTTDDAAQSDDSVAAEIVEDVPELTVLEVTMAERDGYLDDLRRVTAEFANFRKKGEKRNQDVVHFAAAGLVSKLLPVLDGCDAALVQGATDVEPIRSALVETLQREGLKVMEAADQPFDPELHEAVMTEDGDGPPVVAEVLRAGYTWKDRVVRPAMVKVRG